MSAALTPTEVVATLPAAPNGGGLVAAIAAVMNEVHVVAKRGENEFHRYRYATMSDILKEVTPLLGRHGIVIFQSETGRAMFDDDNVIAIEYAFTVAHASGETWPHAIKQTGVSTCRNSKGGWDDKSLNKCHTAARKYFLLALFQIPTGEEADADQGESDNRSQSPPREIKTVVRTIAPAPKHALKPNGIAERAITKRYEQAVRSVGDQGESDNRSQSPPREMKTVVRTIAPAPKHALKPNGIAERAITKRYEQAVRSVGPSQPFPASEAGKAFSPRFRSQAGYDERNPPPHDTAPEGRVAARALIRQLHPMNDELPGDLGPPKTIDTSERDGVPRFLDRRKPNGSAEPSYLDLVGVSAGDGEAPR